MMRNESKNGYCKYLRFLVGGSDGFLTFKFLLSARGTGNLQEEMEKFRAEFFDRSSLLELVWTE